MPNDLPHFARKMGDVDRLIHEPARLLIVTILSIVDSADFLYLQRETELTKGNLSAHLAKLEEAGYIQIEKTYRLKIPLTLCSLTPLGRAAYQSYRQQFQSFLKQTGNDTP
jgi:DNA-binding MarR family transcriptional regulator